jgi:hypothetical protein
MKSPIVICNNLRQSKAINNNKHITPAVNTIFEYLNYDVLKL